MTMRKIISTLMVAIAFLMVGVLAASAEEGFVVIVNDANPTNSISREDLSRLFLKKSTRWTRGERALTVDQKRGTGVRKAFSPFTASP
jgi:ABC-type phosphate transport system substrate-binding protein